MIGCLLESVVEEVGYLRGNNNGGAWGGVVFVNARYCLVFFFTTVVTDANMTQTEVNEANNSFKGSNN